MKGNKNKIDVNKEIKFEKSSWRCVHFRGNEDCSPSSKKDESMK